MINILERQIRLMRANARKYNDLCALYIDKVRAQAYDRIEKYNDKLIKDEIFKWRIFEIIKHNPFDIAFNLIYSSFPNMDLNCWSDCDIVSLKDTVPNKKINITNSYIINYYETYGKFHHKHAIPRKYIIYYHIYQLDDDPSPELQYTRIISNCILLEKRK